MKICWTRLYSKTLNPRANVWFYSIMQKSWILNRIMQKSWILSTCTKALYRSYQFFQQIQPFYGILYHLVSWNVSYNPQYNLPYLCCAGSLGYLPGKGSRKNSSCTWIRCYIEKIEKINIKYTELDLFSKEKRWLQDDILSISKFKQFEL